MDSFYPHKRMKSGLASRCKACTKETAKESQHRRGPEQRKRFNRMKQLRQYGLSLDDYGQMVSEQSGLCAICKEKPEKDLFVDHCHSTGRVRGLLCSNCNTGIGLLRDNTATLLAAINYLKENN